ncbi:PilY2 family type 4a fimbrial biogenesis protein [Pseudomonas sp. F1_0610]|uniref:PilY2 family type 4a fimbrial biogenesis protein n=1 Tax=Pseudomonas sp. F1_0610 TaxID=3114284 RepID=UPI0039C07661
MITSIKSKILLSLALSFCALVGQAYASEFEVVGTVTKLDIAKNHLELSGVEFFLPNKVITEHQEQISQLAIGDDVAVYGAKQTGLKTIYSITIYPRSPQIREANLTDYELNKEQYILDMENSIR